MPSKIDGRVRFPHTNGSCAPVIRWDTRRRKFLGPEEEKGSGSVCELTNRMAGVLLKIDPNKLTATDLPAISACRDLKVLQEARQQSDVFAGLSEGHFDGDSEEAEDVPRRHRRIG